MKKVPCPECGHMFPERGVAVHRRHVHGYTAQKGIIERLHIGEDEPIEKPKRKPYKKSRKVRCPGCGEKFHKQGLGTHRKYKCPAIVGDLTKLLGVEPNRPVQIVQQVQNCWQCGQKLGNPPNYCNNCGRDMQPVIGFVNSGEGGL